MLPLKWQEENTGTLPVAYFDGYGTSAASSYVNYFGGCEKPEDEILNSLLLL
jgi:hypothetical protein